MNKKLRIFLCSLFSVIAIFALAFAVGCDNETVSSASESTSVSDSGTENTGSEESSGETTPDYDFANATWSWTENSDGSYSVTVTVTDKNGGTDLTVTADNVTVTSAVKTAATCTSKGTTTYTATFTYGGNTYTATKDFDDIAIDPDNHAEASVTHTAAVESTATTEGNIEYWYCKDCGKYFSDEKLTTEITKAETVVSVLYSVSLKADTTAWLGDYEGTATFTAPATGIYTITLDTEDENVYAIIYGSTDGSVSVDWGLTDTVVAAEGDTITINLYGSAEIATYNFSITYVTYVSNAVVPTALTINGDTTATLDALNSSYDLEYEVTDATAGAYTFTLSGDDLSDLTVYIYNGGRSIATLGGTTTTATYNYASGDTLEVWAISSSSDEVSFTLNIAVDTTVETRTGYTEDNPVEIWNYVGYDKTLTYEVTTSDTLYFKITGSADVELTLSVTSSDATFAVYGYCSTDTVQEYAVLTATDGIYSFSLNSTSEVEYIKIVPSVAGTITFTLAKVEEKTTTPTENTLTSSGLTLSLVSDGTFFGTEYTFNVQDGGTYILAVSGDSDAEVDYDFDSEAGALYAGDTYTIEVSAGDTFTLHCPHDATLTITKEVSYDITEDGGEWTLANNSTEAKYTTYTFTVTDAGTYTFQVNSTNDISIVTDNEDSTSITSSGLNLGVYGSNYAYLTLIAGEKLTISTWTNTTLTITFGKVDFTVTYDELALNEEITISDGTIYQVTASEDGTFTFTLTSGDFYIAASADPDEYVSTSDYELYDGGDYTTAKIDVTEGDVLYVYTYISYSGIYTTSIFTATFTAAGEEEEDTYTYYQFEGNVYNVSSYDGTSVTSGSYVIEDVLAVGGNMYLNSPSDGVTIDSTTVLYEGVDLTKRISNTTSSKTWTLTVASANDVTIYYGISTTTAGATITNSDGTTVTTLTTATASATHVMSVTISSLAAGSYTITYTGSGTFSIYSIAIGTGSTTPVEDSGESGDQGGEDNKEVMTEGSALAVSLSEDLTYVEAILEVETSGYYTVTVSGTDSANVYVIIGDEDQLYYYDTRYITSTTYIVNYSVTSEDLPIEIEEGATLSVTIALVYGATSADVSVTIALDEYYGETTVTGVTLSYDMANYYSALTASTDPDDESASSYIATNESTIYFLQAGAISTDADDASVLAYTTTQGTSTASTVSETYITTGGGTGTSSGVVGRYFTIDLSDYEGYTVSISVTMSSTGTSERSLILSTSNTTTSTSDGLASATSSSSSTTSDLKYEAEVTSSNSTLYLTCSGSVRVYSITITLTPATAAE